MKMKMWVGTYIKIIKGTRKRKTMMAPIANQKQTPSRAL